MVAIKILKIEKPFVGVADGVYGGVDIAEIDGKIHYETDELKNMSFSFTKDDMEKGMDHIHNLLLDDVAKTLFNEKYTYSSFEELGMESPSCKCYGELDTINSVDEFFEHYDGVYGVRIINKEDKLDEILVKAKKEFNLEIIDNTKEVADKTVSFEKGDIVVAKNGPFKGDEFIVKFIKGDKISCEMTGVKFPVPRDFNSYEIEKVNQDDNNEDVVIIKEITDNQICYSFKNKEEKISINNRTFKECFEAIKSEINEKDIIFVDEDKNDDETIYNIIQDSGINEMSLEEKLEYYTMMEEDLLNHGHDEIKDNIETYEVSYSSISLRVEYNTNDNTMRYYNSNNGEWVENIEQLQQGWGFQDPKTQSLFEEVVSIFSEISDFGEWTNGMEDGETLLHSTGLEFKKW